MNGMTYAAVAAALGGAAMGLAAPASADLVDGTYEYTGTNGTSYTVVFTSCGAGCKRAEYLDTQMSNPIREYRLSGNTWTWPDTQYNGSESIDNSTLAVTAIAHLGGSPVNASGQLVKVG